MRAAVLRSGALTVDELPELSPAAGEVLVDVKACGICGSDLQFIEHGEQMTEIAGRIEGDAPFARLAVDLHRDVFMGHEFAAQILAAGEDTHAPPAGTLVTSMPALLSAGAVEPLVYSNTRVCGYADRMLLSAELILPVPNGLDARSAALTEPMAVGVHAVNRAAMQPGESAVVLGCGPIGIAIIAVLRSRGVDSIIASDPSPLRRSIAEKMGAHRTVDATRSSPFDATYHAAPPAVVFEAAGVPGLLDEAMRRVRKGTRIVVAGVCMQADTLHLIYGASKEVNLVFSNGYGPAEFAEALQLLADGDIVVTPMITGVVDLDGLPGAVDALADADRHCKLIVMP